MDFPSFINWASYCLYCMFHYLKSEERMRGKKPTYSLRSPEMTVVRIRRHPTVCVQSVWKPQIVRQGCSSFRKEKKGAICWIFNSIQALQKSLWIQSFSVELTTENSPHHHPFIFVLLVFNVLSCALWLPVDITNEDMSHRGPICEGGTAMWKSYCWTGKYWMEQKMHVLGRCY